MATQAEESEEDDYLSMVIPDTTSTKIKETSLQRSQRQKREAAESARIPSKAERTANEAAARETGLATELDATTNKGAKMMAKMGFRGGALGKSADGRTRPVEVAMKDDRGGIGMESENKRKVREAAEEMGEVGKRQKVGMDEFRERNRVEREEKKAEGQCWGAMKVLEGLEEGKGEAGDSEGMEAKAKAEDGKKPKSRRLQDVNVLYRPLLRQRLEKEYERKMRRELNNSLSTRNDEADSDGEENAPAFDKRADQLDDEDTKLEEFESVPFAERLERIVGELRSTHQYCFWCKFQYLDAEMDGCPGPTEDEHG